jgi:co-chaperonin GroES (HSP10)
MRSQKQQNPSGLKPLGRAVLVRMIELDEFKTEIIKIPDHVRQSSSVMEQRAEVIAVGAIAWEDEALSVFGFPIWRRPRCKPGDKVIVTRLAGYVAKGPADGKLYRMVNDRDIFCVIQEGE